MGGNAVHTVFDHHFLSTQAGFVNSVTSCPYNIPGDRVTLSVTVINATAGGTCDFELQGSMDGRTWQGIGSFQQSSFGYNEVTQSDVTYPLVRVAASLSGTDVDIMFAAYIASTDLYN